MNQEKIGKFISERRKAKNLTQNDFSEKLGLNAKSISRWERGHNMPDISMLPKICEVLEISLDELLQGEMIREENKKESYEKTILLSLLKNKKNKKIFIYTIVLISILFIFILGIILRYNNLNPSIDIDHISFREGLNKVNEVKKVASFTNYDVYRQKELSLLVYNRNGKFYALDDLINSRRFSWTDLKSHLDDLVKNEKGQKFILYDGGSTIYKVGSGTIIFCNTINGNKDIYYGSRTLEDDLKGAYCGHTADDECYFTRTYTVESIHRGEVLEYKDVVLKMFQAERELVEIWGDYDIKVGHTYEFTFKTDKEFDDTTKNIFKYATLIDVKETDREGLNQINNAVCTNKKS